MKTYSLLILFLLISLLSYAQHTISIELRTDDFGSETTWDLTNTLDNTIIGLGGPYTNVSGGELYNYNFDVDDAGCYKFKIWDSYGDGISSDYGIGYYIVSYDSDIMGLGGYFSFVDSVYGMGGACYTDEIELTKITMSHYAQPLQEIFISGYITNYGSPNLSSFDISYKIDNGNFIAFNNISCNAEWGDTVNFTHNIPVDFTNDGTYTITVEVSNPNGNPDNINDNTLTHQIIVNSNFVERKVLLEHFSTTQCYDCPIAITDISNWLVSRPDVIWIIHHAGYYSDSFTINENTELLPFYNNGGTTYAPAIMLDRTYLSPNCDPGPVFHPETSYTPDLIDQRLATPSYVNIEISGDYDHVTRVLDLNVEGEFLGNVVDQNIRLSVYLIEDSLVSTQAGVPGNYIHNRVMRDAISETFGDIGVISSGTTGTTFTKDYSYTINSEWNANNLKVIAFVNNWDPSNVNDREVINAAQMAISVITNTTELPADNIAIYPNPANNILNINCTEGSIINIYNNHGQEVINIKNASKYNRINVLGLDTGLYFVKITKDNHTLNRKVIIVK